MNSKPILFSAPMVRAILSGQKTQTRRALRGFFPPNRPEFDSESGRLEWFDGDEVVGGIRCPYGQPGDRLWVRETHAVYGDADQYVIHYKATHQIEGSGWTPSIYMRREYSRITLEVVSVRVERLNDISREAAIAEGVDWRNCPQRQSAASFQAQRMAESMGLCAPFVTEIDYRAGFKDLWESINGHGSWDANPWVWVIEFRRLP